MNYGLLRNNDVHAPTGFGAITYVGDPNAAAAYQAELDSLLTQPGQTNNTPPPPPKNEENILDKALDFIGVDPSKLNTGDWIVPIGIGLGVVALIIVLKTVKK